MPGVSETILKRFAQARYKHGCSPAREALSWLDNLTSFTATTTRFGRGIWVRVPRNERRSLVQPLSLYEFEACPYCRKVREVLTELDLDYVSLPVAAGSPRRAALKRRGGKMQVPFLIDPNTDTSLYESDDIVSYLAKTYGAGHDGGWAIPVPSAADNALSFAASLWRLGRGSRCRVPNSRRRLEPLELFNMEGSPFCRKVREVLSELDLQYLVRNVGRGSPQREELARRGGKIQVPFLVDPNRKIALYESDEIVAYLEEHYGGQRK